MGATGFERRQRHLATAVLLAFCGISTGACSGSRGDGGPPDASSDMRAAFQAWVDRLIPAMCANYERCGDIEPGTAEDCVAELEGELDDYDCDAIVAFWAANRGSLDACLDGSMATCDGDDPEDFCPTLGMVNLDTICSSMDAGVDAAAPTGITCGEAVRCVLACGDDSACVGVCLERIAPEAQPAFDGFVACLRDTTCEDPTCLEADCGAEITACRAGTCAGIDYGCDVVNNCCTGGTCVDVGGNGYCLQNCESGSECLSNCCLPVTTTMAVCTDATMCDGVCVGVGEDCSTTSCCLGNVCVNLDGSPRCLARCTSGSDCSSRCCASLESGGSACVTSDYCSSGCTSPGDACSPGDCCPGSTCIWIDYVGARCQAQSAECPSGCTNPFGSSCCRPPFCGGDCVGSPCCS